MYLNAIYYPNWRAYDQPPSLLRLDVISHVLYAFARAGTDGTVSLGDKHVDLEMDVDGTKGCLRAVAALKRRKPGLKVILSVGGGGEGSKPFASAAKDSVSRDKFAQSAKSLVEEFGLDGIDIDWEHPSDGEQGEHYTQLLAAVRASLSSPRYLLTSALPGQEWALKNIDLRCASTHLDFFNIMAYDFSGPWTKQTGHQAQLFTPQEPHAAATISCDSEVTYYVSKGVPPKKLLLGIPAYGWSFLGATGIGQNYSGQGGKGGAFDFKELPRPGTQEYVDQKVGAAFCVGGDGGFISYDNAQTVNMKAAYAKQKGLGGLFYWTGPGDTKDKARSLICTGFNALNA